MPRLVGAVRGAWLRMRRVLAQAALGFFSILVGDRVGWIRRGVMRLSITAPRLVIFGGPYTTLIDRRHLVSFPQCGEGMPPHDQT